MKTNASTILLGGSPPRDSATADAALKPGHLLARLAGDKVRKHNVAGGLVLPLVAFEDEMQGRGIEVEYAADSQVHFLIPQRGDVLQMYLKAGEQTTDGVTYLESAGDGTLRAQVAGTAASEHPQRIVALARRTVDLTGTGAVDTLMPVEIL